MQIKECIVCFGDWRYEISTGVLKKNNIENPGLVVEFQLSKNMQLLLKYFIENSGRLIFKEELISIFGDGLKDKNSQILRLVYSLRKTLGDNGNNPKYIMTLRKRGFRFIPNICYLEQTELRKESVPDYLSELILLFCNSVVMKFFFILFLALISMALSRFIFVFSDDTSNSATLSSISLSSMNGAELEPSISPDGNFVVYSQSVNMQDNYNIIVQNIESKEKWILKNEEKYSIHGAVWSNDGRSIIYQRLQQNEKCEIRKIYFNSSTYKVNSDELLTNCGAFSFASKIQITPDQKFIFFSSRDDRLGQISIIRYSMDNGTSQILTAPPASGLGDYGISISPNGRTLAFLRGATQTHAQLWLMDLNDGALEILHESDDFFPTAITWSHDGKNILFTGNQNSVEIFNIETRQFKPKIKTDYPVVHLVQTIQGDLIFSGGNFWDSSVWKTEYPHAINNRQHVKYIKMISTDRAIQISPAVDGPVAVLSERTGKLGLWFYYPDGKQIEISDLPVKNEYAKGEFSSDGKRFLLQTGDLVWLVDGDKSKPISFEKHRISAQFSWSADGRKIFYTASVYGNLQVYSLDLETGSVDLFDQALTLYAESPNGQYTVKLRHRQKQLEITDSSGESDFLPISGEFDILRRRFVLRNNAIYFLHREQLNADYEVVKYNVLNRNLEYTGIKQKLQGRLLAVSDDERFIFTDDGKKGDIDVRILKVHEEK